MNNGAGMMSRDLDPAETLERIRPLFPKYGITRIADVTGLDVLGIPVAVAARPLAGTLSVSQGKGMTWAAAATSAAMESIEMWHAENVNPSSGVLENPIHLDLPYDWRALDQYPGSLLSDASVSRWIAARGVFSKKETFVPTGCVTLQTGPSEYRALPGFRGSTNGLASGNSYWEAVLHGLYEACERDAVQRSGWSAVPVGLNDRNFSGALLSVVDMIDHAGFRIAVENISSEFGVCVYGCHLVAKEGGPVAGGFGAHHVPEIAAVRAITEAAQSRLTVITGARDDLRTEYTDSGFGSLAFDSRLRSDLDNDEQHSEIPVSEFTDSKEAAEMLSTQIWDKTGNEPLVVDLEGRPEMSVIKVICPGLMFHAKQPNASDVEATPAVAGMYG